MTLYDCVKGFSAPMDVLVFDLKLRSGMRRKTTEEIYQRQMENDLLMGRRLYNAAVPAGCSKICVFEYF